MGGFNPVTVNLLEGGSFLSEERIGHFQGVIEEMAKTGMPDGNMPFQRIEVPQGTVGYQGLLGMGPGGVITAATIPSPDGAYEIQVVLSVAYEGETKLADLFVVDPADLTLKLHGVLFAARSMDSVK